MKKSLTGVVAFALLLLAAAPAVAHVTIQPNESTTGAFARFVVRVPNEHDAASTVRIEVQMPVELEEVRYQPKQGWTRTVTGRTVVWEGGRIAPGEFDEFGFSTRMPESPGVLVFPAVQTYDNGEAVSWTGPEDADRPAARVTVEQGQGENGHGAGDDAAAGETTTDDDNDTLVYVALALSGVSLLVAVLALTAGRRW